MEVRSKSNSSEEIRNKVHAYLAAGAIEVWVVNEDGGLEMHSAAGELTRSQFNVQYTAR